MSVPIQFTTRNGAGSEALMQKTQEKFERLYKLAPKITKIHVIFNMDKLVHVAEAEIHLPRTEPVYAEGRSEDMYKSVDFLIDKLVKQLAKHKDKTREH
jgi:putative sigma-54 modulation protein